MKTKNYKRAAELLAEYKQLGKDAKSLAKHDRNDENIYLRTVTGNLIKLIDMGELSNYVLNHAVDIIEIRMQEIEKELEAI